MIKLPHTGRSDVSDNEMKLRKLDRRDMTLKSFLVFLAIAATILIASGLLKIHDNGQQSARQAITNKEYIKCVVLLRFDMSESEKASRKATEKALDDCAANAVRERSDE